MERIEWESSLAAGTRILLKSFENGKVVFSADNLNADNYREILNNKNNSRKGVMTVYFEGFDDAAAQKINLTVPAQNVKPSLRFHLSSTKIYPDFGWNSGELKIYDKKMKNYLTLTEECAVSCSNKAVKPAVNEEGFIDLDCGGIIEGSIKRSVSKNIKLTLREPSWTQEVVLPYRIVAARTPELTLSAKSVTLNKAVCGEEFTPITVDISIEGGMSLENLTITENEWIKDGTLKCEYDKTTQQIRLLLQKPPKRTGSRRLTLIGTIRNSVSGEDAEITGTLLVRIVSGKISIGLKASGSVNVLERDIPVIYTPKVYNLTDYVQEVNLGEGSENAELFEISKNDDTGFIEVRAKKGVSLDTGKRYKLHLEITLGTGHKVLQNITIRPIQRNPRLTTPVTRVTLYRGTGGSADYFVTVPADSLAEISGVTLAEGKYSDEFQVGEYQDGSLLLSLKPGTDIKRGTYTLRFLIDFEGRAENRKAVTKNLRVTIK